MKVCEVCGADIDGKKDGDNRCNKCENVSRRSPKARRNRSMVDDVMESLGLVKARGILGGTYYE